MTLREIYEKETGRIAITPLKHGRGRIDPAYVLWLESRWISVKERLPEKSTPMQYNWVLVWFRKQVIRGYYSSLGTWHIEGSPSDFSDEVMLWQPLPPAPKEGI
jgi:hypothetical protein